MALQSGNELQLGAHYIIPKADFKNQGSTTVLTTPLSGGNGGDGGKAAVVPNLFYMHSFSEKWTAGIGITAPYGLTTEYDDDWGFGANVGLIFEPLVGTRVGIHYRSKIDHTLEGDANFYTPAAAAGFDQAAGLINTTATAEVSLPETVSISAYHAFNQHWAILADATWTKWSRLEELRIKFGSGANDSVTTLDWDDTWRFSLGGIFKPTDPLELRAGVALDESPIPNDERRTPRIPGADRIWLTLGGGYQFTQLIRLDLAYAHLLVDDPKINKTATSEDTLRGALVGEYDASVDIISASISFQF